MPENGMVILIAGVLGAAIMALFMGFALLREKKRGQQSDRLLKEAEARLHEAQMQQQQAEDKAQHWGEAVDKLERDVREAREKLQEASSQLAAREALMLEREQAVKQERETLTSMRGEIEEKFKGLAHETFKASQKSFLELAEETFKRHKSSAEGDLRERQQAIQNLLKPMQDSLKRYEDNLGHIEKARHEAYGHLTSELKNVLQAQDGVRSETAKLVMALRAQPKTRGRWGEHQLQTVMELAGMSEHVDFHTQASFSDENDKLLMPDAVLRLPGRRTIVVDAKTSLSAYFNAIEAVEETVRDGFLVKHAQEIRTHMKQLGAKAYWNALKDTPDFVAMFIPGENFYAAAIERDPDLFEDAINNRVLIVTPTTLIALAKAVAYGWRQEAMAENARQVADLGRELYGRLSTMGNHVVATGRNLDRAVKSYNSMVGSLERSVMPQARKFEDLKVDDRAKDLEELSPIASDVRELSSPDIISSVDALPPE
ncbi:hypothetical protein GCM10007972_10290 [Iodidimonas muriae]|uniref:DNA recombination protein RmuC homolog n=1 Tax=Iodidimonas muriae TaxID=261467 RepID=A0ABQ2LBB7_9PROT|nr:DNA recombination protein RmuC [Iodidimonas muriae]GER08030.1 hypothetical protein JCM17843_23400 [Kordiimonadales bacterium JCM 17843]GGO09100.1 hypothetical protein GCM10007972_10290 [Iodidimonas muriae]